MSKGPNKTALAVQWLNNTNFKPFKRKELNLHLADDGATMGGPNNLLYALVEYGYCKWVDPGAYQMEQLVTYEIVSDCLTKYKGMQIAKKKRYHNTIKPGAVQTELELIKKECEQPAEMDIDKAHDIVYQEIYKEYNKKEATTITEFPAWSNVPTEKQKHRRKRIRKKQSWLNRIIQPIRKLFASFFV